MNNELKPVSNLKKYILPMMCYSRMILEGILKSSSRSSSTYYSFSARIVIIIFSLLFLTEVQLIAQTNLRESQNQTFLLKQKKNVPSLENAKIPSGLTFPSVLEKVYGDVDYELGPEVDMNGMLISYFAEDTSIVRIQGNKAMILKAGETQVSAEITQYQHQTNSVPLVQSLKVHPGSLKLTVVPNQQKEFGQLDPDLEFETHGLVYGDGMEVFSGTLQRASGENLGKYPIAIGSLDAGNNYEIEFIGTDFEIIPRDVIVEAQPIQKYFGSMDPKLNFVIQGNDSADLESVVTGELARKEGEQVGQYAIQSGSLKVAENYKLSFLAAIFEIRPTELTVVFDPSEIETDWSVMPDFPSSLNGMTQDGQILEFPVSWLKSDLNLFEKGACTVSGTIDLPEGISNPQGIKPSQKLVILPKPSPEDLLLSRVKFDPNNSLESVEIGQFQVIDKLDDIHSILLIDGFMDNLQFAIEGTTLYWKKAPKSQIKNNYSISVKVLDRVGNSLEKEFSLKTEYTQLSQIHVYNVFTPNNDGFNDFWGIPEAGESQEVQIQILNKYGNILFESENPKNFWDGTYMGKAVPEDTYFWVLRSKSTGETRKGFLTLIL